MARRIGLFSGFLALVFFIPDAHVVGGGAKKSDSEVKVTATASKRDAGGKQVVTITLAHSKGWHTYANPVDNEDFSSNKTVVTLYAQGKPIDAKVEYPAGKLIKTKDKNIGDYRIYDEKTEIKAAVKRAVGDTSPLEINVKIIACHDARGECLLPATVKVNLP